MRNGTAQKRKKRSLYVKKRNRRVKSVVLVVVCLGLLTAVFVGKSLIAPAVSALNSSSNSLKDKDIYSILIAERNDKNCLDRLTVLIAQKNDKKLYSLEIAPGRKVDLPGRLGEEELGNVLELGKSLNFEKVDQDLLVESVKQLLNFNVDRYIIASPDIFPIIQKTSINGSLEALLPWELKKIISQTQTNITASEFIDFALFSKSLSSRDRVTVGLENTANINLEIRDITLNGRVAQENLSVVVLNGTVSENAAQNISEIFQNIGSRIALADNAENEYEKSYLIANDPLSPTVLYIKSYFPNLNVVDSKSASSFGEDLLERGDITFIVGFDIQSKM